MLVSLYTVRVVLATLGAEDYGIYNVVAGVVTMFGFLSGAMATASQRYFSFEMGKGTETSLSKIFSVTLSIYALLCLVIILFAETLGLWFVNYKLVIPENRMAAANVIYQCAVGSFLLTVMTTPYMSDIIAHENMNVYAYVSIVEAVLKLVVVLVLRIGHADKLVLYGVLLLCVAAINTSLYRSYCRRRYTECRFRLLWDGKLFREMFSFIGWTLFGQFTTVVRYQAVTILLNQFFTPVVVAAKSIAQQVTNAVNVFSANFNTSLYPPIIKEYSFGNKEEMFRLINSGCKMTFFLMWVFTLPLVLHLDFVMSLWLKEVPEWTLLFTRLSLIEVLINSLSYPISTAARAPGKMRAYELTLGIMQILIFAISLVLFKAGFPAWSTFAVGIGMTALMMIVRLFIVRNLVQFSIARFAVEVMLPIFAICLVSAGISIFSYMLFPETVIFRIFHIFLCVAVSAVSMLFIGMDRNQREKTVLMLKRKLLHSNGGEK